MNLALHSSINKCFKNANVIGNPEREFCFNFFLFVVLLIIYPTTIDSNINLLNVTLCFQSKQKTLFQNLEKVK